MEIDEKTLKGNIQYSDEVTCTIYEDAQRFRCNKELVRQIKSDILLALTNRTNAKSLDLLNGPNDIKIDFESSDLIPELIDQKSVIPFEFKIMFKLDIKMDA